MIYYQNPFALRVAAEEAGIVFVGAVTAGVANSAAEFTASLNGTLTGGIASSPANGDDIIVIAACSTSNATSGVKCAGDTNGNYTQIIAPVYVDSIRDTRLTAWAYRQGGTPDTLLAVDAGTNQTTAGSAAIILVFRGVDAATRLDVARATATGIDNNDPDPPARTPVTDLALFLAVGCSSCGPAATAELVRNSGWSPSVYHSVVGSLSGIKLAVEGKVWRTGDGEINPAAWADADTPETDYTWIAGAIVLRPAT